MGRPRKETSGTSSPQPASATSKTTPAAPPPSASATRAKAAAAGSRSRSTPAAGVTTPSQGQGAKSGSSQPRPSTPATGVTSSSQGRSAKPDSSQPRPVASRGGVRDQHKASAGSCSATPKKLPNAKGDASSTRLDARSQKQQPGADWSGSCDRFLAPLESQDILEVEKETRGQRSNPKWYEWRENRITASVAPRIANSKFANGKTDEVPKSYLKAVVSSSPGVQTPAMSWGLRNEKVAVQAYEQLKSQAVGKPVQVEDCGLFIHQEKKWIAASPDGIVKEAATGKVLGLLEVKCPYKHRNRTVREACKDKDFCLKVDGDSYALKEDHAYFTQVQCQLASAGFQQADFVVHTTKETAVVPVEFNAEFWGQTVPKLEKFYTQAVIPYLEEKVGESVWGKEE